MNIQAIFQISHYDQEWGFYPQWVLDNHLPHLLDRLQQISPAPDISLVTGTHDQDDPLVQLAQQHDIESIRVNKEDYQNNGLFTVNPDPTTDYVMIVSGYTAIIDIEKINELIFDVLSKETPGIFYNLGTCKNHPLLISRSLYEQGQKQFSGALFTHHKTPWRWFLKEVSFWLNPGMFGGWFWIESDQSLERYHTQWDRSNEQFEIIIDSKEKAIFWSELREEIDFNENKEEGDRPYEQAVKAFSKLFGRKHYPYPRALQLILPENKQELSRFCESMLSDWLSSLEEGALYKPYLKLMGEHLDEIPEELINVLTDLKDRFHIGLHLSDLAPEIELDLLINNVHEIFWHLESLGNIGPDGEGLPKRFVDLQNAVKEKRDEINSKRDRKKPIVHPLISVVYSFSEPEKVAKSISQSSMKARKFYQQKTDEFQTPERRDDAFYDDPLAVNFLILNPVGKAISNYSPLIPKNEEGPKLCKRALESITITGDVDVKVCDQAEEPAKALNGHSPEIIWKETSNDIENHSCELWYQPVI